LRERNVMMARSIRAIAAVVVGLCLACSVEAAEKPGRIELYYERLGTMITVGLPSGRVEGIYLFQRTGPTVLEAGKNEVVLGVGAYGVAIGDSEDSLDAKRRVGETGGYMGYE